MEVVKTVDIDTLLAQGLAIVKEAKGFLNSENLQPEHNAILAQLVALCGQDILSVLIEENSNNQKYR